MSTAAPAPTRGILRVERQLVPARGGLRAVVLHRLLALADILGTLTAVVVASHLAGLGTYDALALSAACALVMPVIAFCSGLYAADDLRSWATGVPDLKRLLFAALVLSWPLFALASGSGAQRPVIVTLAGTILTLSLIHISEPTRPY